MEIVRSAFPIYRSTMIPASRVALLSSIQVNDRGKAAPAVPYRRSDLVLWPEPEATAGDRGVRLLGSCGRDAYLRLQQSLHRSEGCIDVVCLGVRCSSKFF